MTIQDFDRADKNPRVTVITLFLNGEAFLAEAIESVIAQNYDDWEFILVNDGSGPVATKIAKAYAALYPTRIRYLEHPARENRGMSASRNLGVNHARGELIAFIDADDIWMPGKLAEHVALLDAHPEVGMVCGTTVYWHSWSQGADQLVPTGHRQDVVIYPPEAAIAVFPLGAAPPPSMSDIVLRAALVRRLGGFEERFTGHYESRVFLSKLFLTTLVYFSRTPSNKYRQHPDSCVQSAIRQGKHVQNKLVFLEWLEQYLQGRNGIDPRVRYALKRELRPYRNPRLNRLFLAGTNLVKHIRHSVGQTLRLMGIIRPSGH